jgi:F420-non-reducing hydrogenase iron-sulfur subunit
VIEEMLALMDLDRQRFGLVWCSSAEAELFADTVREMTSALQQLGPSPYRSQNAARATCPGEGVQCL